MDAAALALKIDSSDVVKAANDLDRFASSATKAGAASIGQTGSIAKLVAAAQAMDSKLGAIVGALDRVATAQNSAARAAQTMASANDNAGKTLGKADAHVTAYTQHLASLVAAANAAGSAQSTTATGANAAAKALASADSHVSVYRAHLESLAAQARATAAATASATGGPRPAAGGGTASSAAELQRYAAAARAVGPANEIATATTLTLSTAQSKLSLTVRTATADLRAQADALRDLNGGADAGGGGAGAGAARSLAVSFGALEAAANAAAAALRTIDASGGGGGGGNPPDRPDPASRSSSSPYYGAAGIEVTGQAAQLASHHAQNLFYQLNDVFVSLISGQKPMTVFIQQGSQIGQIYTQTGLTLKGFALGLASMIGLLTTTTAATEAAAFAQAQQATASIAAANAQAVSNVRAAETNIAIAQTQIAMATTATEAAAAEARLAVATAALGPAQAEAAITGEALAKAQADQAAAANAARAATTTSLTGLGIAAVAAAGFLAVAAIGIATLTKQANDTNGLKKYTTEMGYTKAEVKKLNAVTVEFGDTMKAVWDATLSSAAEALGFNTKTMSKTWDSFLDRLISGTRATLAGVYALFAGTKAYLGEVEKGGVLGIGKMLIGQGDPKLLEKTYGKAYQDSQKFMDGIVAQSRANARARQDKMAKEMYDPKKQPKGPKPFTYDDLMKDAQKMRDELTKAQAQIGLYGEALSKVTYEQDLLNKASERGLKLSPAQRTAIAGIATDLAKLAENNRHSKFMEDFNQQSSQQIRSLEQTNGAIGLTGAALVEYTTYQDLVNKALADHIKLTDADRDAMRRHAKEVADGTYGNTVAQSREDGQRAHNEAMRQLGVERGELGLTGAALISYIYQQQEINRQRQQGVLDADLNLKTIKSEGDAYAAQRMQIDQQTRALADAREVSRGFFGDWINGARQGANIFTSFADSAVNALNRIIDKLLDKTLDSFLDGMFQGGSSGGILGKILGGKSAPTYVSPFAGSASVSSLAPNALGGVYGSPTRFANGGTFTNTIVNTPTLFRFANGGKLGEMGEAGPEAIMPLKRGPNGALGVQMHGGGKPAIRMGDYNPSFSFEGAVGLDGIASMVRQGGEATYNQMKRDLQTLLQQLDTDGAFAS